MLAGTEALQAAMFAEMKGRIKEDDSSVPAPDGAYAYYTCATRPAPSTAIHVRTLKAGGTEEILLDEESRGEGQGRSIGRGRRPFARPQALFAFAVDEQGSEVCRIFVKDLATGAVLGEPGRERHRRLLLVARLQWLFWVWRDDKGRPAKVFRRPARGTGADDVLIYEEPDDGFFLGVGVVASQKPSSSSAAATRRPARTWLIPAAIPPPSPVVVEPRQVGRALRVEHWRGEFVIRTNATAPSTGSWSPRPRPRPASAHWKDWIAHQPGR
jgi:oligopeptidase B